MILTCNCTANSHGVTDSAKYQDKIYGKGKRLYTYCKETAFRCTVCGKQASKGFKEKK
jgi:hypothetical protein